MTIAALSSIALLAGALAGAAPTTPQVRVRLVMASHLPQATGTQTVHAATCGAVAYRLAVSPGSKSVVLSASGVPDTDLSTTSLGARLLEQDVLVDVGFNCPLNRLNIFIKGVKLADLGAPTGFRDHVSVGLDGSVGKTSPSAVDISEMATPPLGVSSMPVQPRAD